MSLWESYSELTLRICYVPGTILASLVVQAVRSLPSVQKIPVLGREDPLEKGMATHSSILAWRIPWTEEWASVHGVTKSRTRLSDSHTPRGTILSSLHILTNLLLPSTQWGRNFYYLQIIEEGTEKQRHQVLCPGHKAEKWQSHSWGPDSRALIPKLYSFIYMDITCLI